MLPIEDIIPLFKTEIPNVLSNMIFKNHKNTIVSFNINN